MHTKTVLFLFLLTTGVSSAAVFDTVNQIELRYGKPVRIEAPVAPATSSATYSQSGYQVFVNFIDGRALYLKYTKPKLTVEECETLLNANREAVSPWKIFHHAHVSGTDWIRGDKRATAHSDADKVGTYLEISAADWTQAVALTIKPGVAAANQLEAMKPFPPSMPAGAINGSSSVNALAGWIPQSGDWGMEEGWMVGKPTKDSKGTCLSEASLRKVPFTVSILAKNVGTELGYLNLHVELGPKYGMGLGNIGNKYLVVVGPEKEHDFRQRISCEQGKSYNLEIRVGDVEIVFLLDHTAIHTIKRTESSKEGRVVVSTLFNRSIAFQDSSSIANGKSVVEIPATSERAYVVGPLQKGTVVRLQYVSGKWKSWGHIPTACPDDPNVERGDRNRLAIVNLSSDGKAELLSIVPSETAKKPFEFLIPDNAKNVVLRINDTDGDFKSNPDAHVKYSLEVVKR